MYQNDSMISKYNNVDMYRAVLICHLFCMFVLEFCAHLLNEVIYHLFSLSHTGTYSNLYNRPKLIQDPLKVKKLSFCQECI